jgi:hypothetical protein
MTRAAAVHPRDLAGREHAAGGTALAEEPRGALAPAFNGNELEITTANGFGMVTVAKGHRIAAE